MKPWIQKKGVWLTMAVYQRIDGFHRCRQCGVYGEYDEIEDTPLGHSCSVECLKVLEEKARLKEQK